jgi:uncharacterized protein
MSTSSSATSATWNKPLPRATAQSQPFWDGLKSRQVKLQHCSGCAAWNFFPRLHCPACGSRTMVWREVSGEGQLYSFTVARVPTLPEFTDEMPQLLAVVQLDEGPHINTTMVGVSPEALKVGQRVRPVFDERPGSVSLLRYTAVDAAQATVMLAESVLAEPVEAPATQAPQAPRRTIDVHDLPALRSLISAEFSDWSNSYLVTQELINQFAALSGDDYWLHTDPVRARDEGPFGTTIAHGALVQVLMSRLTLSLTYEVTGFKNPCPRVAAFTRATASRPWSPPKAA